MIACVLIFAKRLDLHGCDAPRLDYLLCLHLGRQCSQFAPAVTGTPYPTCSRNTGLGDSLHCLFVKQGHIVFNQPRDIARIITDQIFNLFPLVLAEI